MLFLRGSHRVDHGHMGRTHGLPSGPQAVEAHPSHCSRLSHTIGRQLPLQRTWAVCDPMVWRHRAPRVAPQPTRMGPRRPSFPVKRVRPRYCRTLRTLLPIALLTLPGLAQASGLSTDISVSPVAAAGVSVGPIQLTSVATSGSVRVGWAADYTHRPMDQYRCSGPESDACGEVIGTVIGDRVVGVVALGVAMSRRTWIEATIPAAAQWGGSVAPLSPDGVVLGDPRIGLRTRFIDGPQSLDGYAEASLPLGKQGAWFAHTLPTVHMGAVGAVTSGPVTGLLDIAGWIKQSTPSNPWDFRLGSALLIDAGVMVAVSSQTALWTIAQSRFSDGAPALVGSVGVAIDLSPELRIDLGVGRAFAVAPGAGPVHGRLTLTYSLSRAERMPAEPAITPSELEVSPDSWDDDQTIRVRDGRVELRKPITFVPDEAIPSLSSYPDIAQLAEWLTATDNVEHLLIAAYAHSKGTSSANYTLSLSRAQGIADALVFAGVPRSQLSYKGMGMLSPDADSGEHHVVVDGEVLSHTTLNIMDYTDAQDTASELSFDVWFAAQDRDAP
jgi:hypothetical protein